MMVHLFTALSALTGFVLLLLAMARHQQEWLRRKLAPATSQRLRRGGFALLALAYLIAELGHGWGYGTVAWCGWLSLCALVVLTAQTNRERILRLFS